jgi:prepilin-type N-terminal cleavage/methylation domain-containing protein
MWSEPVYRSSERRKVQAPEQGFTLMELMTVVVIVGVLSAIAVPTFSNYIYKARASEATEFLGIIRLREESYRSEFGVYCPTIANGNAVTVLDSKGNLVPNPTTNPRDPKTFTPSSTGWSNLGARPTGPVRFGYGVAAGTPSEAASQGIGFDNATADFWFVARAVGDLDADGTFCTFEIYSASKNVWIGDDAQRPLLKGWE